MPRRTFGETKRCRPLITRDKTDSETFRVRAMPTGVTEGFASNIDFKVWLK